MNTEITINRKHVEAAIAYCRAMVEMSNDAHGRAEDAWKATDSEWNREAYAHSMQVAKNKIDAYGKTWAFALRLDTYFATDDAIVSVNMTVDFVSENAPCMEMVMAKVK